MEVALVALAGVLIGGLLTGWFQRANTKMLMVAELRKVTAQIEGEASKRIVDRKHTELLATLPELLSHSDPELHARFDYRRIVALVHRAELVLNLQGSVADARLARATSDLATVVRHATTVERDDAMILRAMAEVTEAARAVLR